MTLVEDGEVEFIQGSGIPAMGSCSGVGSLDSTPNTGWTTGDG